MPFGRLVTSFLEPLYQIREGREQKSGPPGKRKGRTNDEERRRELVRRLIEASSEYGPDVYPVIRLVAPELDVETGPSGIKEKVMAKILPRALGFHGQLSADRIRLVEWGPETHDEDGRPIAFMDICEDAIQNRVGRKNSTITVDEVCGLLDQLRTETKEDKRVEVLQDIYHQMTASELTWAVRIILDGVHLGVNSIFMRLWDEKAQDLMSSRSCLRAVCWLLARPARQPGPDELGVRLFWCFGPQVASRQVTGTDGSLRDLLDKTVARLKVGDGERFYIEEKLDGERMQMHMDVGRDGKMTFRWWSRQGVDYTHIYGSSASTGTLARHIGGAFAAGTNDFEPLASMILDGEMVVWDSDSDAILPHTTHAPSSDHGASIWPLFRAFDMLQLNGKTLTGYPLEERHEVMALYLGKVDHRLERHPGASAATVEELEGAFTDAMLDGREGLVVKSLSSPYRPGVRDSSWMKVKPEYSSEYGRPLACVIIGASYGRGANSGNLTRYLCGIREGGESDRWLSFCGLGIGISRLVRREIDLRTQGKWRSWGDGVAASEFIQLGSAEYERPDRWIRPDESVVVTVKASAISHSNMYAAETALLHPRLDQLPALEPAQALSKADIEAMDPVRSVRNSVAASKPVKKRAGGKVLTVNGLHSDEAMATPAEKDLFGQASFFIGAACDDPPLSKDEMVVLVRKNGGVISYRSYESDYALSDKITLLMLRRIKVTGKGVIHPRWLVDCDKQQRFVELEESHHTRWDGGVGGDDSDDSDGDYFESA